MTIATYTTEILNSLKAKALKLCIICKVDTQVALDFDDAKLFYMLKTLN
jgi:hypothetical protein